MLFKILIKKSDYYLDVDSTHPVGIEANKGLTVRQLKCYVSWVKNVAIQFGSYLVENNFISYYF